MSNDYGDKYAAGPQGLGYLYQPKLALLRIFEQPEDVGVIIEGQDDLEFIGDGNDRDLASLKHRAEGDRITDLSADFWKSINIWLTRYRSAGAASCSLKFFLYTTSSVPSGSFVAHFEDGSSQPRDTLREGFEAAMAKSHSKIIKPIRTEYYMLEPEERDDFLSRIVVFSESPRITDTSSIISDKYLRAVERRFRKAVIERLEGWWQEQTILQISKERAEPIYGYEVFDKLSSISQEYRVDNLPITYREALPPEDVDPEDDDRLFVKQLMALEISPARIQNAVIDYYRAFQERSSWAREELLNVGEVKSFESRLVDEWKIYKDIVIDELSDEAADQELKKAGRKIYTWVETQTDRVRIRDRVNEPYILRGSFHILANQSPEPRVHWHPKFLEELSSVLEVGD